MIVLVNSTIDTVFSCILLSFLLICSLILIYLGTKNTILLGISFFFLGIYTLINLLVNEFSNHNFENILCSILFISSIILMGYFYIIQFLNIDYYIKLFKKVTMIIEIILIIMIFFYATVSSDTLYFINIPILIILTFYFVPIGLFSLVKLTKSIISSQKNHPSTEKQSNRIFYTINFGLIISVLMIFLRFINLNLVANIGYTISTILTTYGYILLGRFDTLQSRIYNPDKYRMELEDTAENYRTIVKTTRNLILRCNLKGRIEFINPAVIDFLHYAPIEVTKKNMIDYVVEKDIRLILRVLERINQGNSVHDVEFNMVGKDNQVINVIGNFSPIFTSEQNMRGFISIINNISLQKSITKRMNKFMNYLNLINDFSMLGMNLSITSLKFLQNVLPKVGNSFNLARISFVKNLDEITKTRTIDWLNPKISMDFPSENMLNTYSKEELEEITKSKLMIPIPMTKENSCKKYFMLKAIIIRDNPFGYIIFEIDGIEVLDKIREYSIVIDNMILTMENVVSLLDYKYSLEETVDERTAKLIRITEELKSEVIERKRLEFVLKDALKEAMSSNEAKNIFLANLSHELRTPLNAIIGFSEILTDRFEKGKQTEEKEFTKNINESGIFLLTYISKILDLSKLESGMQKINVESFSIEVLFEHIISNYKKSIEDKELIVSTRIDPPNLECRTDFDRIKLILCNILENSILYTDNKGRIDISVQSEKEYDKDYLIFTISDNGVGIPDKEQGKIFSPFVHIENTKIKMNQRSGLGLYISKLYVETLGGKIWFVSSMENGTVFYVSIQKNIERI